MSGRARRTSGGRRGRRAVTRIEKLVAARAAVEQALDRRIEQEVARARRRGVSWRRIVRALAGAPGSARGRRAR